MIHLISRAKQAIEKGRQSGALFYKTVRHKFTNSERKKEKRVS